MGTISEAQVVQRKVSKREGRRVAETFRYAWTEVCTERSKDVDNAFELMIKEDMKAEKQHEKLNKPNSCTVM